MDTRGSGRFRTTIAIGVSLAVLQLAACGDSGHGDPFILCGNGVVDPGEICDNGGICSGTTNMLCTSQADCPGDSICEVLDNDPCLSTCVPNECGDEFVNVGVEECDGLVLNPNGNLTPPYTCADLGFSAGTLSCSSECRFDTSQCGATFTATATRANTATPTATPSGQMPPTATPTATFTPTPPPDCGNNIIDGGETCDDGNVSDDDACPSDCVILPCTPSGGTRTVQVNFMWPAFQEADSSRVLITYPDGSVSLPGQGNTPSVDERVAMRQSSSTVTPNDLDHALRVVYSRVPMIDVGKIFTIAFDECQGATPAPIGAFTCRVTGCSNFAGDISGCTCAVVEPEQ